MEDKDLKKILKCNVPHVELDSKKILYNCKNHKKRIKILRISSLLVSTVFISLIIGIILIVLNRPSVDKAEDKNNGETEKSIAFDIGKNKDAKELVINGYIDYCVAYGVDGINKVKSSVLYDLDIISEEDKVILKEIDQKNGIRYINLYFAVKDSKDVIVISYLERPFGEEGTLIFDSNLNFKFDDLKEEFENIIGESITNEFLNDRYQIYQDSRLPSGIFLELLEDNNQYSLKFTIYYKNQEHIIYK